MNRQLSAVVVAIMMVANWGCSSEGVKSSRTLEEQQHQHYHVHGMEISHGHLHTASKSAGHEHSHEHEPEAEEAPPDNL